MSGYRTIGSFHSAPIDELIAEAQQPGYQPPPSVLDEIAIDPAGPIEPCTTSIRDHFRLDLEHWLFLNHGAFGASTRTALHAADAWRHYVEKQPLRALDRELLPLLVAATTVAARTLQSPLSRTVLLPNASAGLTTMFRAIPFQPGDLIFMLDSAYGTVSKIARRWQQRFGVEPYIHSVRLDSLLTWNELVEEVTAAIEQLQQTRGKKVRLALFDAVTSGSALCMPIVKLVAGARAAGVEYVGVDAAHAWGALPELLLGELDADFAVTNGHKWFYTPKGVAALVIGSRIDPEQIEPPVISHGMEGSLHERFIWEGTRDYSPALSLIVQERWWQMAGGLQPAAERCRTLLNEGGKLLVEQWKTQWLVQSPQWRSHMACIALPATLWSGEADSGDAKRVQDRLHFQYRTEVPVKCHQGKLYLRLSAALYNTLEDFERLSVIVDKMVGEK